MGDESRMEIQDGAVLRLQPAPLNSNASSPRRNSTAISGQRRFSLIGGHRRNLTSSDSGRPDVLSSATLVLGVDSTLMIRGSSGHDGGRGQADKAAPSENGNITSVKIAVGSI